MFAGLLLISIPLTIVVMSFKAFSVRDLDTQLRIFGSHVIYCIFCWGFGYAILLSEYIHCTFALISILKLVQSLCVKLRTFNNALI